MVWGDPTVVKGCLNGEMLRSDVRSHCEVGNDKDEEPFTCFCDGRDFCNGERAVQRLEVESVPLYSCVCQGPHCRAKTCLGELCTYVFNHRSKVSERGCVNASVPLVERRSAGACMIPPITGAMHHTVAKTAEDLLHTESCVCEGDYCNSKKPKPTVPERANCRAFVHVEVMGQRMSSKNVSCTGEFCFRAEISSKLGHMSKFRTMGCATFMEDAKLAEELEPTGCAKFKSEKVQVEACFQTKDREAISRARQSRQGHGKKSKTRGRPRSSEQEPPEEAAGEVDEWENEEAEEEAPAGTGEGAEETKEKEETEPKEEEEEKEGEKEEEEEEKPQHYIFEPATLAPQPEESTNSTLISVFLLLILLILLSGAVWKLQLHKKLFRANYDTVAGGG